MTDYNFATFAGYSINGIALNDMSRGWKLLRDGTNTQGGISKTLSKVSSPGRPGYLPAPASYTEQVVVMAMRVTHAGLEPLLALADAATVFSRTDDASKQAYCQLVSAIPSSDAPKDSMFDVTVTLNLYEGVWRDVAVAVGSDNPTTIASPTQLIHYGAGLSAPIFDAQIFLRGVFGQFQLADAGGSWLKTTRAWPGSSLTGLLWIGSTQQAFLANESDPFTPVSDASQYVDASANGGFQITPVLIGGDPSNREAQLTLTTLSQTSTTLRIRAKRAYRMN